MKINILALFVILNFNVVNADTININQNEIFKNIRCLICQGQSVADSNSEFAQTIKSVSDIVASKSSLISNNGGNLKSPK